jgi:hypothetical protein
MIEEAKKAQMPPQAPPQPQNPNPPPQGA